MMVYDSTSETVTLPGVHVTRASGSKEWSASFGRVYAHGPTKTAAKQALAERLSEVFEQPESPAAVWADDQDGVWVAVQDTDGYCAGIVRDGKLSGTTVMGNGTPAEAFTQSEGMRLLGIIGR